MLSMSPQQSPPEPFLLWSGQVCTLLCPEALSLCSDPGFSTFLRASSFRSRFLGKGAVLTIEDFLIWNSFLLPWHWTHGLSGWSPRPFLSLWIFKMFLLSLPHGISLGEKPLPPDPWTLWESVPSSLCGMFLCPLRGVSLGSVLCWEGVFRMEILLCL